MVAHMESRVLRRRTVLASSGRGAGTTFASIISWSAEGEKKSQLKKCFFIKKKKEFFFFLYIK